MFHWIELTHVTLRDFNHSLLHSCGWMKKVNWFRHTSFISSIHHSISFNSTPWIDWNENEWSHSLRRPFELVSLAAVAPLHWLPLHSLHLTFREWMQASIEGRSHGSLRSVSSLLSIRLHFFHSVQLPSLIYDNSKVSRHRGAKQNYRWISIIICKIKQTSCYC